MWLPQFKEGLDRRSFLKSGTGIIIGLTTMPNILLGEEKVKIFDKPRSIRIERFGKVYDIEFEDEYGKIIDDGYKTLCRVFGDFRANEAILMDIELFRVIARGQDWLKTQGYNKTPILTSGYRTMQTNLHTEGAAMHSKHPEGKAGDIKYPSIKPSYVAQLGRACGAKGVGLYPTFTHLDTGKFRSWVG